MDTRCKLTLRNPNGCCLLKAPESEPPTRGFNAPALELLTDFRIQPAITIGSDARIDDALDHMIVSGVRLLFVIDRNSGLSGSVTSYDIQGEKPMLYLQSRDCRINTCSRADIVAGDIMTPVSAWQVLHYGHLINATLGDIVRTLRRLGERHLIVTEPRGNDGMQSLRGLYSASALETALSIHIEQDHAVNGFSEVERALMR
jgi:hypothetical protein